MERFFQKQCVSEGNTNNRGITAHLQRESPDCHDADGCAFPTISIQRTLPACRCSGLFLDCSFFASMCSQGATNARSPPAPQKWNILYQRHKFVYQVAGGWFRSLLDPLMSLCTIPIVLRRAILFSHQRWHRSFSPFRGRAAALRKMLVHGTPLAKGSRGHARSTGEKSL